MYKVIVIFFFLSPLCLFGQNPIKGNESNKEIVTDTAVIKNISAKLGDYTKDHVTEKVYLQLDKPYYAAGDTIYFKGYITDGGQHVLSNLSGVLYVELINTNNRVSQLLKLPVDKGQTWGDFTLPDTLKAGSYHVRAYTNWMRNADNDYFFNETIVIGNPGNGALQLKPATAKLTQQPAITDKPAAKIDIQFFPESGYLVTGVRSKVAFKAIDANGLGTIIKGAIVDNDNNEIAQITTQHLGMGLFFITPEPGKTYTAKFIYADGTEHKTALPLANDKGYVLSVYNNDALNVVVKIATNDATFQRDKNTNINLIVQTGGNIIYSAKTKLTEIVFSTQVAKSRFPSGIAQFTIFSENGEPLNERVILVQNADQLNIALSADKNSYSTRGKVNLGIVAKDKNAIPVSGAFSIAVTDETKVPIEEQNETTILSNILLTSDIKGYVEKPNYYFTNVSDQTRADLDVLMLTQGYRRFIWKQVISDSYVAPTFKPEKGLTITGNIKTKTGKPIPKGKVSLVSNTGGIFRDTVADDQGRFAFSNLAFADTMRFLVKGRKINESDNVLITVDNINPPTVNPLSPVIVVSNMDNYLQNSKKQYIALLNSGLIKGKNVLNEVNIKSTKPQQPVRHSDNLNTPGTYDYLVKSDKLRLFGSLVEGLRGIPGMSFAKGRAYYHDQAHSVPMLIVLDGTPMVDNKDAPFTLDDINVEQVANIEVLSSLANTAVYGTQGVNGILVITTKKTPQDYIDGWGPPEDYTPGMVTYKTHGYYVARQFYAPNYDDPKTNLRVADLRTTIYWNPNIITDKDGRSAVSFFNADTPGIYKAVIEGIDTDGNIGRQVFRYKVE